MSYQLTIVFDDLDELTKAVKAISAAPTAQAATTEEKAVEHKTRAKKSANGKPAESLEAETPAESKTESDPADSLKQALRICRALIETGGDDAMKDLKALRAELGGNQLSKTPPELVGQFLTKVQALQAKHSE